VVKNFIKTVERKPRALVVEVIDPRWFEGMDELKRNLEAL
jgi:hypothetical protein